MVRVKAEVVYVFRKGTVSKRSREDGNEWRGQDVTLIFFIAKKHFRMESYAKHLLVCSSVGSKLTTHLQQSIGEMASEPETGSAEAKAQRILRAVGFDATVILLKDEGNVSLGLSNVHIAFWRDQRVGEGGVS
jgi:reverse gyrase